MSTKTELMFRINVGGLSEVAELMTRVVHEAWDAAREGEPVDIGHGEIGTKYRYPKFLDWPGSQTIEQFSKNTQAVERECEAAMTDDRFLSDMTDADFTAFLALVEQHRIRRLSMKIAVPWSDKQEERDSE